MRIEQRYKGVIDWFSENKPVAVSELIYNSPFELLVAVVLSAQCTDKRVNIVTKNLFKEMPTAQVMASKSVEDIYELIKSVSFPNNKSKHLHQLSNMIVGEFGGEVPNNIENLQKLPGVGRKTANVIVSIIFDTPAMAVDTHVFRVSRRIGLTKNAKNPLQAEMQLVKHIPNSLLSIAHHWLILHGRYVCVARKPKCEQCGIKQFCNDYKKIQKIF